MIFDFDPTTAQDPALLPVLGQLKAREPIFHRPEFGTTQADFERMMAPEFWEIGASGSRYNREFILAELKRRYESDYHDEWRTEGFRCQHLAGDVYLLTYTLFQSTRMTRRMTIWRRVANDWQIVFHQGTIVE